MAAEPDVLFELIEKQFLEAVAEAAEIVETPAFRVHIGDADDPFYRTVAVPRQRPADPGADAWQPTIEAMRRAFAAAGRQPRLEFIEERWPDLPAALEAAGFRPEGRLPLMVAGRAPLTEDWSLGEPPARAAGAWLLAAEEAVTLADYLAAVHASFGRPLGRSSLAREVARLQLAIADGRCIVAVVTDASGAVAAGASLIGIGQALRATELAGVWTAPRQRRRGLARAVCTALLERFFATGGGLVWLGADGPVSRALYGGIGFREIGRQCNFSAARS